jgi:hypothetical protein
MLAYALVVVAVVLLLPTKRRLYAEAGQLFGRPHSPRQLIVTSSAFSNHSNMPFDLCFTFGYAQIIQICPPIFASYSGMLKSFRYAF